MTSWDTESPRTGPFHSHLRLPRSATPSHSEFTAGVPGNVKLLPVFCSQSCCTHAPPPSGLEGESTHAPGGLVIGERHCIHRFLPAIPTHKSIAITSDASDYVVSLATCYAPVNVKYSTFGCELLALYLAIRHFCLLLEG